jgi:hypothetical protein
MFLLKEEVMTGQNVPANLRFGYSRWAGHFVPLILSPLIDPLPAYLLPRSHCDSEVRGVFSVKLCVFAPPWLYMITTFRIKILNNKFNSLLIFVILQ